MPCAARASSKPDHTRFVHSGGDSWLLLSDQTVDLDGDFGLIVKPRDFIVPGPISLQMMLDILDQIAYALALMIAGALVVHIATGPFNRIGSGTIRRQPQQLISGML